MRQVDTILLVEDIAKSKRFYTEILSFEIIHDWGNMVIFKDRLSLHQANKLLPSIETKKFIKEGKQGSNNIIIYIELEDQNIETVYSELQSKNISFIHGIQKLPWQRIFRIMDPDNYIIEIGEKQS